MHTILTFLLGFFISSWFFWIWEPLFCIFAYALIFKERRQDFPSSPLWLIFIGISAVFIKYHWAFNIKHISISILIYFITGFIVSLVKWVQILSSFKKELTKQIASHPDTDYSDYSSPIEMGFPADSIEKDGKKYYLNWREFPIGTWWTYWPFFLLSVIFDPIEKLLRNLVTFISKLYSNIALKFSVNG